MSLQPNDLITGLIVKDKIAHSVLYELVMDNLQFLIYQNEHDSFIWEPDDGTLYFMFMYDYYIYTDEFME